MAEKCNLNSLIAHPKLSRYPPHMRKVNYSLYMLPSVGKKPPHVSSWKMSATEAAGLGALYPIPGTVEVRELPDTEAERLAFYAGHPSAGRDGVRTTKG